MSFFNKKSFIPILFAYSIKGIVSGFAPMINNFFPFKLSVISHKPFFYPIL